MAELGFLAQLLVSLFLALLGVQLLGMSLRALSRATLLFYRAAHPLSAERPSTPPVGRSVALQGTAVPQDPLQPAGAVFSPCLWYELRWRRGNDRFRYTQRSDRTRFHLHYLEERRIRVLAEEAEFDGLTRKLPDRPGRLRFLPLGAPVTVVGEVAAASDGRPALQAGLLCGLLVTRQPPRPAGMNQLALSLVLGLGVLGSGLLIGLIWTL